jgi:very-short-patch-repair endonuclease
VPGAVARARRLRRDLTLPEKLLWAELRKLDLNIRRQAPIGRYIADFACHGPKLVVEIDSERHDLPESQLHDAERSAWLNAQGYKVLRFRNGEVVDDLPRVVDAIAAVLQGAPRAAASDAARPTPPSPALPPSRGKGEIA